MGLLSFMIREFYQDRTVLLTGGTGFYGQGLTAKILRYLPEIRRLYLILRPSRGPMVSLCRLTSVYRAFLSKSSLIVFAVKTRPLSLLRVARCGRSPVI